MPKVNIKPLSVNQAWKGRRFRSDKYKDYQQELSLLLPKKLEVPEGRLKLTIEWGFSSHGSDNDNPIKPFQDVLCSHLGINDNRIYHHDIRKEVVPKGKEYILFDLTAIN